VRRVIVVILGGRVGVGVIRAHDAGSRSDRR
jgi:hypothetical protein